jgi:T5SS/PEP-CTERM-associated repeat protein
MKRKKSYQQLFLSLVGSYSEKKNTANTVTTIDKKFKLNRFTKWLKKSAMIGILTASAITFVTPVKAVDVIIENGRVYSQPNRGTGGTNGTPGASGNLSPGSTSHWFGLSVGSGGNNVLRWLETANGGAVTISRLDNFYVEASNNQWYTWNGTTYILNAGVQLGAYWDPRCYIYTGFGSQTVNLTTGTTHLNTGVDPTSYSGYGAAAVFNIDGNMIKAGTGTLSLEIEKLKITTVTANANSGTIQLANSGTAALTTGTLTSVTANLNGGNGTFSGTNNTTASSTFDFNSAGANNKWSIATLNGGGFNSTGIMNVSGSAILDRTTNIHTALGQLDVVGTTSVGTTAGQSILNVQSAGILHSHGAFTASSNGASQVFFNIDGVSRVTTDNNASFSTVTGSRVDGRITSGSTWTNTGTFVIAQNGTANITVTDINSQLNSTNDIIVANNTSSNGTLNVLNSGLVHTNNNIDVAKGQSARGTVTVDNSTVTAGGYIHVASGVSSTGNMTAMNNATVTASTSIEVSMANGSTGRFNADNATITAADGHLILAGAGWATMNISNGGKVSVADASTITPNAGNAFFATNVTGYGSGTVTGNGSLFEVAHNLVVGEAGTGLLFVENQGKTTIGGDHIIANNATNTDKSFGRDVVSNQGVMTVGNDLIVGNKGNAGGKYDYIGVGYSGGTLTDPPNWAGSLNLTTTPKLADGSPDSTWVPPLSINSPGLAVLSGGQVTVERDAYAGKEKEGYAYILLDNNYNNTLNSSTLHVKQDFYVADMGEAYLRINNGGVVDVDRNVYIGNQGFNPSNPVATTGFVGHGTVRINGSDTNLKASQLNVGADLITGNKAGSSGYLYAHNEGKVNVTGNHIIGNETGSFGRDHFDGNGTQLTVVKDLQVGNSGKAGGSFEYRIDGSNDDPTVWFDSHNLLLEPGNVNVTIGGVTKSWSDIEKNAPGLAITDDAKAIADNVYAGTLNGSFSYILIDDKGAGSNKAGLKAIHNMEIANAGTAYTRLLNGAQIEVGTAGTLPADTLTIGKSAGSHGTLRIGNTGTNTGTSQVQINGTLITADNGTNGNTAKGYLYASDGSQTQVIGNHVVAQGQYSFGRDHFNGNGTTLNVVSTQAGDSTIIAKAGESGGHYRYVLGGGGKIDPTVKTEFSNNGNGKWFDSANLLFEPDQITVGNNANYSTLTWNDVKNNSPGFALTAGAKAMTNDTIVADGMTAYGYILLDNIDNDNTSSANRSTWTITDAANPANFLLANNGTAYARVINGSLLSVKNEMIVANEGTSEATIRINGFDQGAVNNATLIVGDNLTVAKKTGAEGYLYAYETAQVTVGDTNAHTGDFTIAEETNTYGRVHFDGENTSGKVGDTLIVGQFGHAGLLYNYIPHLRDSAGTFDNKVNDPGSWFDSVNTLDDDVDTVTKEGYTINPTNNQRTFVGGLISQNNAPGFLVSDGAKVTSGLGMVAQEASSIGYAVIDNKGLHGTGRSTWTIDNGELTIAEHGTAYVRVLNGAMLNTTDTSNNGYVVVAESDQSRAVLRVQDDDSELVVAGDLTTAKNGSVGQGNIAIGSFYLHNKATADVSGNHTIAEGIYSEGRDHIDGDGTEMKIAGTLTVGQSGFAGNYVYHKGDSSNANDPTNNSAEFNQWFDSANTLITSDDAGNWNKVKENTVGLAITAGAVVNSGSGMVAENATTNTLTNPADSDGTSFRSNGYFVVDNTGNNTVRSTWNLLQSYGNADLTVAREGTGYGRVINGALLNVEHNMVIADLSDNGGTGNARSDGTVRVYGTGNKTGNNYRSELIVGNNLTTANEGTGSLYIYQEANAEITSDHKIASIKDSYGNDHIDGHNSTMKVGGLLTVGDYGQAGGRYDYIANGKNGGISKDPEKWFDSDNTLFTFGDTNWVGNNSPGLAITAGAVVRSGGGVVGQHRNADGTQSYGYVAIDSKDKTVAGDRSQWLVRSNDLSGGQTTNNTLTVAENGEAYVRVMNGSLLEVGIDGQFDGKMRIGSGDYGYGTVRVNHADPTSGQRPELIVHGDLVTGGSGSNAASTAYATGNLYAHDQARIQVDNNHVIAEGVFSTGRDHIDGVGTTMNVDRTLTVGQNGAAGGWYQENRYINPSNNPAILPDNHYYAQDPNSKFNPERWLDQEERTLENLNRTLNNLGDPQNAKVGTTTGNSPGLAITAGAVVTSGSGMVAENATANGYVLIDDKRTGADSKDDSVRTRWIVKDDGVPFGTDGKLTVGGAGNAFVRVLNGSLLQADSVTVAKNGAVPDAPHGYLYVVGGKESPQDAAGNPIPLIDALTGKATTSTGKTVTWQPSEWISKGATVLGETVGDERGTLRIEEGAHGVTRGLYLGLAQSSQGEVSVSGTNDSPNDNPNAVRSLLEIYEDISALKGSTPQGSSTLSVSDYGYLWMHQNSELRLNGVGIISNGAILHLSEAKEKLLGEFSETDPSATAGTFTNNDIAQKDRTALLDAMKSKVTIINARIEGDGIVTGEDGVFISYNPMLTHNPTGTQTTVDPGQRYDWNNRDEYFAYYGTLVFGDQLRLSGDVVTNFDVNSGYYAGMGGAGSSVTPREPNHDAIVVTRGKSSGSQADVLAKLSGTLNVHARLTDYYQAQNDLLVVQTIGDSKPGTILSMYDKLKVMPQRFFENPHQEVRQDTSKNDQLWVTLKRKNNPFEESGNTYNEKETGKGLDSVYMDQITSGRKDWLPVLRYFWYLDDPDFLNAYRLFSGEVRAHSLLLPITNQWRYAHNRIDFRNCNNLKHGHIKPCDEIEGVSEEYIRCGAAKSRWKEHFQRLIKDVRLWGSVQYDDMESDNDGNAADSRLHRYGIVVGADRPFLRPESYLGVMVGLNRGKLNTFQAKAQDDDLSVGLYHGTKLFENWEWKNYLGAGIQDYNMKRNINVNLTDLVWQEDEHYFANNPLGNFGGNLTSDFLGYSLSGSTEFARPFYFGQCGEYMFRPYMALDLAMVWQNNASETGNFENSQLVALDYLSATNIRVYGRPGFLVERNGRHTSFHAGLSYAFLMGGRRYTDVNNRFQIGGNSFNIRGIDDGSGYVTWNFGGNVYLGKKKHCSLILDYWGSAGSHSVTQSAQFGFQKKF